MSDSIWQLGIESSAPRASLVLVCDGRLVAERVVEATQNHSAVIAQPLGEVLRELPAGASLAEVVIATGPGSYNGARVGLAAGQGVAMVHECPAVGISSLEAVDQVREGGRCLAVGDARRGSFFTVALESGRVRSEPDLLEHEVFLMQLMQADREGVWIFSLEEVSRLCLPEELATKVIQVMPEARLAVASWDARAEMDKELLRSTPPQPFYLRPPNITKAKTR